MRKIINIFKKILIITLVANAAVSTVSANLIFSAPPRENQTLGKETYEPIANYLSTILDQPVVYHQPTNWTEYATKMRAGKYDIVFDGPHFAAWRIKNASHVPLVRLPGTLGFVVVVKSENVKIKSLNNLLGKTICGLASPNLGTVAVFSLYENPVYQPEFVNISGGMRKVAEAFLNTDKCGAAVLRDKVYHSLPKLKQNTVKIIASSESMPNQTITVSQRISAGDRDKIAKAMTSTKGLFAAEKLLSRFSKKKKLFIPAKIEEYEGLEDLLEGVVYGW